MLDIKQVDGKIGSAGPGDFLYILRRCKKSSDGLRVYRIRVLSFLDLGLNSRNLFIVTKDAVGIRIVSKSNLMKKLHLDFALRQELGISEEDVKKRWLRDHENRK